MSESELKKLIDSWLDGRIDGEGSKVLQQAMLNSLEAREVFRDYAQLDAALHEMADVSSMFVPVGLVDRTNVDRASGNRSASIVGASQTQSHEQVRSVTRGVKRTFSYGQVAAWCGALAVGVVIAFFASSYLADVEQQPVRIAEKGQEGVGSSVDETRVAYMPRPPAPIATLAFAKHAVWVERQLEVGQSLYEGEEIALQEGSARISLGFGAELVADAPCSLTFLASDRVHLHQGNIAVDVAPWAKGFTVVTEEMDIVDLGTTFTVSASPGVKSETTVLQGLVRVHPSKVRNEQRRGFLVTEGQQVSIDGQGFLENVKNPESLRLRDSYDFGMAEPYRPVALNNTGHGLAVGDEDQHWRVIAGPEGRYKGPQFATVCVPHERYLPNEPQKSQWISIADWETAAANSNYTFQAVFDLEGYDLSTMQLFGRFLADNGIAEVRVNGEPVQVQSWVDNVKYQPFGDPQFRFVNVTEGLVEGRNVIEVDVRNGMQRRWDKSSKAVELSAIPNPMALRVEWYAFGRQHSLADVGESAELFRLNDRESFQVLAQFDKMLEN